MKNLISLIVIAWGLYIISQISHTLAFGVFIVVVGMMYYTNGKS